MKLRVIQNPILYSVILKTISRSESQTLTLSQSLTTFCKTKQGWPQCQPCLLLNIIVVRISIFRPYRTYIELGNSYSTNIFVRQLADSSIRNLIWVELNLSTKVDRSVRT